jgi:hypothetical protein
MSKLTDRMTEMFSRYTDSGEAECDEDYNMVDSNGKPLKSISAAKVFYPRVAYTAPSPNPQSIEDLELVMENNRKVIELTTPIGVFFYRYTPEDYDDSNLVELLIAIKSEGCLIDTVHFYEILTGNQIKRLQVLKDHTDVGDLELLPELSSISIQDIHFREKGNAYKLNLVKRSQSSKSVQPMQPIQPIQPIQSIQPIQPILPPPPGSPEQWYTQCRPIRNT